MGIGIGNGVGWGRVTMTSTPAVNEAFEFTVKTDNAGTSASNQFTIPIISATPYNIETSDGQSITGATGATTLTFPSAGTYTVSITESCEGWRFNNGGDKFKLLDISNWGVFKNTVTNAFQGASNMTCSAIDAPINAPTTMNSVFSLCPKFNGAIGNWNVSGVTDFFGCFSGASVFNQPLDAWDTSLATTFRYMFNACTLFNQPINSWNTNSIVGTGYANMFQGAASFNQPLDTWNLSNATDISAMFINATSFNGDLSGWDVSNITRMRSLFRNTSFNNPSINNWNVGNVTDMQQMFTVSPFNQDISGWDVSSVTNVYWMFNGSFNQPIGSWNLASCTSLAWMFYGATSFEQDLSAWDVSGVTDMSVLFSSMGTTEKYLNIAGWNTANVTNMASMLSGSRITDDLSNWDVSSCINFQTLTPYGKIYFDLSEWAVQGPVNLNNMIRDTYTDQNIIDQWNFSGWDISQCVSLGTQFALLETLTTPNYDATLISWAAQAPVNALTAHFGFSKYSLGSAAETARTSLINTYGWTIIDGGAIDNRFTITIDTTLGDGLDQFTIPTAGGGYNYNVETSDGQIITGNTGNTTISFAASGTYDIKISGDFPQIFFNSGGDRLKLTDIKKWGSISWSSMANAFQGCSNLAITATDAPNLSLVTSLRLMFNGCGGLTINNVNNWDVSNVTNMSYLFSYCTFNDDISLWDTSSVTTFERTFQNNSAFNQPIGSWDTSSATRMDYMFNNADSFNQDISAWNTSLVTNMSYMFYQNNSFNNGGQPLTWDTSSVTNMEWMFFQANAITADITSWDVSSVTTMRQMFNLTSFNQDISVWNTSSLQIMESMLGNNPVFNFPIGNWNTSNVFNYGFALYNSDAFDQSLANWNILAMTTAGQFMRLATGLSTANYGATLVSWEAQLQTAYPGGVGYTPNISIDFGGSKYILGSTAETARTSLINTYGWTIVDGGGIVDTTTFVFTVENTFNSNPLSFTIPADTATYTYDYNVSTSDGQTFTNQTGPLTLNFAGVGPYDITVSGTYPSMRFGTNANSANKIVDIKQFGTNVWQDFRDMFAYTQLSVVTATDTPDLSAVTSLRSCFKAATSYNDPKLNNWDVSTITSFETFLWCAGPIVYGSFNQDLSSWDTSQATNFYYMFYGCPMNQSFAAWDVTSLGIGLGNPSLAGSNFINPQGQTPMSTANYDATLISWAAQSVQTGVGVQFFGGVQYTLGGAAEAARNTLVNTYGWTIFDSGGI